MVVSSPAVARDNFFENKWVICDTQRHTQASPQERIEACNYVITNARRIGGGDLMPTKDVTRGTHIYVAAHFDLARAYNAAGQYDDAITQIGRFLELARGKKSFSVDLNPFLILGAYRARALSHLQLAQFDLVRDDLREADSVFQARTWQTSSSAMKSINDDIKGDLAMAQRQYSAAVQYYESFAKRKPKDPEFFAKLALAKKFAEQPSPTTPEPPPPLGSPGSPSTPCKMYPNLC